MRAYVRVLEGDEQIQIGDSCFVFLLPERDLSSSVVRAEDGHDFQSTIRIPRVDVLELQPENLARFLPPSNRYEQDLRALIQVATHLQGTRGTNNVQQLVLLQLLDRVPADQGAIVLTDESGRELSIVSRNGRNTEERPFVLSRTLVRRVSSNHEAIVTNNVRNSETLGSIESLSASPALSVLVAPLLVDGQAIGVIYLQNCRAGGSFDEHHLRFATTIAGLAAAAIENACRLEALEEQKRILEQELRLKHDMVGHHPAMVEVYRGISKVCRSDVTVMIGGESGTGKELAARAIIENSARAGKPVIAISCAVINENLLESELFGHERGAFTGAVVQKKGKFELAHGGTLFLDEVGELSPVLQAKLLRFLETRGFERLGGTHTIKVDVRLITATHRNLLEEVQQGRFREDLYYRLNVVTLTMPPLRERAEDIPLLAERFMREFSSQCNRRIRCISPDALSWLVNYRWPGNVRELRNAVERAVVMGLTDEILPEDLPDSMLAGPPPAGTPGSARSYHEAVREARRQIVLQAVEKANGNFIKAAESLAIHPNNLHRLVRDLNLRELLPKTE